MSNLKPVFRVTLSEQVAMQIASMISSGQWRAGERLPSEAQLCKTLHIGRSTLREALKSLAFVGMVHMRVGEGTYVAEGPSKFLERIFAQGVLVTEKDVTDLCETRILLETELAALSAQRATDEDLHRLEQLVHRMSEYLHSENTAFLNLDLEFHLQIADSSKNQVLTQLLRTIRKLLEEYIVKSQRLPGARELAYEGHLKIFEALKERNSHKARVLMRDHLRTFQRGYKLILSASESESSQSSGEMVASWHSPGASRTGSLVKNAKS